MIDYLLSDTSFWAMLGVIVFFGILAWFKVPGMIAGQLDDRAAKIKNDLDEARRMREEAQELLASFQRKQREAEAEAEAIIEQAKADAKHLRDESRTELAARLERRTALAEQRIAQAEAHAVAEVKALAADLATDAAARLISENLKKADHSKRIKADLDDLEKRLN
ncbi:F0F1 ATP synthase subunit B [Hyphobacterium sp.]|jgi:F-type H+-transporting ATPase subunit b|uniref:F0F1 ATP synthase subunit B family protein n=1 Tax=Hyphobacterium sp. TaxID=2004662 RepID=UPI003BAD3654